MYMILVISICLHKLVILHILFKQLLNLGRMNHELIKQKLVLLHVANSQDLEEDLLRAFWDIDLVHLWPSRVSNVVTFLREMKVFAIVDSVVNLFSAFRGYQLGAWDVDLKSWVKAAYFIGYFSFKPALFAFGFLLSNLMMVFMCSISRYTWSFFCLFAM